MTLYTKDGSYPASIPFRITLADGSTRTDPSTFSAGEIADAGYFEAPAQPEYDPAAHRLEWDGEDWQVVGLPPPTSAEIDAERDLRIDGGIEFGGVVYQTRPSDRENLAGASTLALSAMVAGAQPGDLRWHGGDNDFAWIAEDNSVNTMDAQTLFALGAAAANRKAALIFAARALKDMDPVPRDFADDQYWP